MAKINIRTKAHDALDKALKERGLTPGAKPIKKNKKVKKK